MKKVISALILSFLVFSSMNVYSQKESKEDSDMKARVKVIEPARVESHEKAVIEALEISARASQRASESARASAGTRSSSSYSFGDGFYVMSNSGSSSSQLSLSKTFNGESKKNEGSFDVDDEVRNISLTLNGTVRSGEIKIKITLFNGDVIKEMTIDESADIQFNQTIKIAEDEKKYYGKWRYSVESVKAEGNYRLMIHTR